jgi:hypothetical protein
MCCRRRPRVAGAGAGGHYAGYCSPSTFDDTPADPIAHGAGKLRVGGLIVVAPFAACGGAFDAFVQRLVKGAKPLVKRGFAHADRLTLNG